MTPDLPPGPTNSLVDVAGLSVGHHQRIGDGHLTGTTVVLAPPEGAVAGVDVRGGGPGTRETDLLAPENLVERVHAIALSGGSAFGLAAADGVMRRLLDEGRGLPMGGPGDVVPIVPGAVIFDLGRGGVWGATPDAGSGRAAVAAALAAEIPADDSGRPADDSGRPVDDSGSRSATSGSQPVALGVVGAGTGGQLAGGLKGGVGSASAVLPSGATVAALVVVNAAGSAVDPRTGELFGAGHLLDGDLDLPGRPTITGLRTPHTDEVDAARARAEEPGPQGLPRTLATTIGVLATDLDLTVAQCRRLAMSGHDGLARAIRPAHTMFDGDTLFGLATGDQEAPDPQVFHLALHASAEVVTRATVRATLAAESVTTPAGTWRSYREAFPSAVRADEER